jgi:hypothetical protein
MTAGDGSDGSVLREHLSAIKGDPLLGIWAVIILLDPIYVFKSGLPQPGDILLFIFAPFVLARWKGRLRRQSARAARALMWFLGYVVLSAVLWSFIAGMWSFNAKRGFFQTPWYYIFDALVFLVLLVLYERHGERFVKLTIWATLISVGLQFAITFIYTRGGPLRSYGLFNNANQLGYFAILSACLLFLGARRARIPTLLFVGAQLACCYFALLSASRAALGAAAILMMVSVLNQLKSLIAVGLIAAIFLFVTNPFEAAIDRAHTRITTDESLGLLEERGYDRIVDHPEYLLLGAGEGGYNRYYYTSAIRAHEIHSSAGTLIFCYGIVGTSLFLVFLWNVIRGASPQRILLLLPAAAYGLSHQGLRFTSLWVLLAVVVMLNDLDKRERRTT